MLRYTLMKSEDEPMFRVLAGVFKDTRDAELTATETVARFVSLTAMLEYINTITEPELTDIEQVEEWVTWWLRKHDEVMEIVDPIIILPDQSL